MTEELLGADDVEDAEVPADNDLAKIAQHAERRLEIIDLVANLQAQLDALGKEATQIEERLLPDALTAVGMKSFKLQNGYEVELSRLVVAAIPEDRRDDAFKYLREQNAGDLIKRTVTMAFGKGEDDQATLLVAKAAELFPDHVPEDKTTVHAKTLAVWVRTRDDDGLPTDDGLLGVYRKSYARIKAPAKPRAKKAK